MWYFVAVLLFLSSSLAVAQERAIAGVKAVAQERAIAGVKAVATFADGKATIEVINNSQHNITGYAVGIVANLRNGESRFSEKVRDYGPPALNLETPLRPGNTSEETEIFPRSVVSVDAKLIVAIYDDQTADVLKEDIFKHLVLDRQEIGAAFQVSAGIFRKASLDSAPLSRARAEFSNAITAMKNGELFADKGILEANADEVERAPLGNEASFMADKAKYLERQAAAYKPYAVVRRLP
jgi:hypothetical protein